MLLGNMVGFDISLNPLGGLLRRSQGVRMKSSNLGVRAVSEEVVHRLRNDGARNSQHALGWIPQNARGY
jgi:hypothetical protein